jgi:hypothetical protein
MHHLVVLHEAYLDLILRGRKRVECRLSTMKKAPFGVVRPGDLLWFKLPSRGVRAVGVVKRALFFELTPNRDLMQLAATYGSLICAESRFFESAGSWARFASLIWITAAARIRPIDFRKSDQRAWVPLHGPPVDGQRLTASGLKGRASRPLRRPTALRPPSRH